MATEANIKAVDVWIGQRLRAAREMRGLSRPGLSDALGYHRSQIVKWEGADVRLFAANLFEISRLLDVPIEWFFEGFEGEGVGPASEDREAFIRQYDLYTKENSETLEQLMKLPKSAQDTIRHLIHVLVTKE